MLAQNAVFYMIRFGHGFVESQMDHLRRPRSDSLMTWSSTPCPPLLGEKKRRSGDTLRTPGRSSASLHLFGITAVLGSRFLRNSVTASRALAEDKSLHSLLRIPKLLVNPTAPFRASLRPNSKASFSADGCLLDVALLVYSPDEEFLRIFHANGLEEVLHGGYRAIEERLALGGSRPQ